jgi:hypothetical protein
LQVESSAQILLHVLFMHVTKYSRYELQLVQWCLPKAAAYASPKLAVYTETSVDRATCIYVFKISSLKFQKNLKNKYRCQQCCVLLPCKNSNRNTLYYRMHRWQNMTPIVVTQMTKSDTYSSEKYKISKLQKSIRFCYLCSPQYKVLRVCTYGRSQHCVL